MSLHKVSLLRSCRRSTGLTQDDVAFLIGVRVASQVSRHESGEREPDLRLTLAYKLVFDASAQELLPDIFFIVAQQVRSRAEARLAELDVDDGQRTSCRTAHLRQLVARIDAILESV